MKNNSFFMRYASLIILTLAAADTALYSWSFYRWIVPAYSASLLLLFLTGAAGTALFSFCKGREKRASLLRGITVGALYTGGVMLLTFLINNMITGTNRPWIAALTFTAVNFCFWLCWSIRIIKIGDTGKKTAKTALSILLSFCLLICGCLPLYPEYVNYLYQNAGRLPAPTGTGVHTEETQTLVNDADFYISPNGSDSGDGSLAHPLATIEKARDLIRETDKTGKTGVIVALMAGEYKTAGLTFSEEDSGTENCPVTYCAYGDGEVILNGGVILSPSSFSAVEDEATLERLCNEAKENVVCTDLTKLGLTAADWGKLYSVGGYSSASHYDGDTTGPVPCVLYYNGAPMTTARYPDSGTLKVKGVVREGEGKENSTSNHEPRADWDTLRNPETTIFTIDDATADRVNKYASLDNVWLWTALIYNWADGTSPLKSFDYDKKTMEPAYVSFYGAVAGSDYYIFNVIEELDSPGEWFLDRDTGMVYLYPDEDFWNAQISLSLSTEDAVIVDGAEHLRFDGLCVRGTRGNGISVRGNDILISRCTVSEVSGTGISIDGYENAVSNCTLSHIGATGADITGGDRETLTPGNNRVENCLFHDYSEVALTAGPGVNLNGVGNVCTHNEFYASPQQAIFYSGNNMLIEYNLMHDVALLSDDCSAIYAGRRWDCCGSVVRYNIMYDLGDGEHSPNGIYWDDGMSGQTAYGNLIVNCKQNGFLIGGGRDNQVYNNILLNCATPISYDDRSRDGVLNPDSWFKHSKEGADLQQHLEEMPWQSETWLNAYPYTADWTLDYSDTENPDFIPNPANSKVSGNLIVQYAGNFGRADESVYRFSDLSGNAVYKMGGLKKLFADPDSGDYTLRADAPVFNDLPDFEPLPIGEIGRY